MAMTVINITGLDKVEVLRALYNCARPTDLSSFKRTERVLTRDEAEWIWQQFERLGCYFRYVRGRVLNVRLRGDALSVGLYERDNGKGAARDALKKHGLSPSEKPARADGFVTVLAGFGGYFAVHMIDGEPETCAPGRHVEREAAEKEGNRWAALLGVMFLPMHGEPMRHRRPTIEGKNDDANPVECSSAATSRLA
jgi:hypothetical protein